MKKNSFSCYKSLKVNDVYSLLILFFLVLDLENMSEPKTEINLIILGTGQINIINDSFYLDPSKVIVNGEPNPSCKKNAPLKMVYIM